MTGSSPNHHLSTAPETASWGWLPNQDTPFVRSVDPGPDPVAYFTRHGVDPAGVLDDAIAMRRRICTVV